jgi:recombination protein RecR
MDDSKTRPDSRPTGREIETLIALLAKLPGLGPRSARRAALQLIKKREALLAPLAQAMSEAALHVHPCGVCGNLDTVDPCGLCCDGRRDPSQICVVEEVGDLWALERAGVFRGRYHVLGGTLSALDGVGPDNLAVAGLMSRVEQGGIAEIVLAMNATVDGQATAHYLAERLAPFGVRVSRLAHGVPMGGELDYLDDGTLDAAFRARRNF